MLESSATTRNPFRNRHGLLLMAMVALVYGWFYNGANANHAYTLPGIYSVALTVGDGDLVDSTQISVSVLDEDFAGGIISHW